MFGRYEGEKWREGLLGLDKINEFERAVIFAVKQIWIVEDAGKKIRAILGYRYAHPLSFEEETGKMILSYENKTRCTHVKK